MVMFYFSGTGNSEYIARKFSERMEIVCHSIEENIDFGKLLSQTDTLVVCYPIYGSTVPRIMREFAQKYGSIICKKKLIIFCTQMCFSGDGARAFARLIPGCEKNVLYAEHFNMPGNICNIPLLPIREKERIRKKKAADKKIELVCRNIRNGIYKKRGWCIGSTILGKMQNGTFPKTEEKGRSSFHADGDCIKCGLCVKKCPVHNLELADGKVVQKNLCILCYRCVNICPQKAATVWIARKPTHQYKGIEDKM
jgi:ferredoxin